MADVTEVLVPDIGDFTDVPIIEILVEPGATVAAEDPLVTLESDKATMDVPAPFAGTVGELKIKIGDTVSEGSPLLTLAPDGASPASDNGSTAAHEGEAKPKQEATHPAGAVTDATEAEAEDGGGEKPVPPPKPDGPPLYASPSVRRLAREKGVDLASITGSGRKGRITKEDVERGPQAAPSAGADTGGSEAASARAGASAQKAPSGKGGGIAIDGLPAWPKVDHASFGPVEVVALPRIKKISGPVLHRNWVQIPHVTHNDDADITDLEAFRKETNDRVAKTEGVKVTMVALLVKAVVSSLKAFPEVNSSLEGDELVLKRYYHIGFAADTPQGLVVPVIKDADQKGILDIARDLTTLSGKARDGKLGPADMKGGTFTISSLGGIGGTSFTPIVNAPEVAILGVTRSAMKPVWNGKEFVPRLLVPLSLSYDHRVIDGALAARFVSHLASVLSDLRRAIL